MTLSPPSSPERRRLLRIARRSVLAAVNGAMPPRIEWAGVALSRPGATFVTLRRRDSGKLRGCCGETVARRSVVDSVVAMARLSALEDPRFPPVASHEVEDLAIEITLLGPLEPIRATEVVVGRHGLALSLGERRGLLLPQVPVDHALDRSAFLAALCRKAGLPAAAWSWSGARLEAFEATSWSEGASPPRRGRGG